MRVRSTSNIAAVVIEACGDDGCERLVAAFGGMRIAIPKTVADKFLQRLGADVLTALVNAYGGETIDVPSRGHAERIRKSMRLKHDAIHSDLSASELAAKHSVTAAWVHKLRTQLREPAAKTPTKKKA